jgi:diguanylate cyclase (GGDEF)-like protein
MRAEFCMQVLLVDDDVDDAFLTREAIADVAGFSCHVTHVTTSQEAVALLSEGTFDVCLLDFRLGADTGLDVLDQLRIRGILTPCILLTGQDDAETDRLALAAGAVDFLVKGRFDGDSITRAMRYAVRSAVHLQSMQTSEKRFRSVVEAATDAILVVGDNGTVSMWNPCAVTLFDGNAETFDSRLFFERFFDIADCTSVSEVIKLLRQRDEQPWATTFELTGRSDRTDREPVPCELTLSSWQADDGLHWTVIVRDIAKRKAMEDRLIHQAFHDPLTGLANRSLFRNRVQHALDRLERRSGFVGVLFCDLDNFKRINDTLGHGAGDELLIAVAQRLELCIRTNDTAARLGGDEFAILVEDATDQRIAVSVADRVLKALNRPFTIGEHEVVVSASVGIELATDYNSDADDLLRNADVAMYSAKNAGKGCYSVFENSMHHALVKRLQIEQDLREAITTNAFTVMYQPIVRLPELGLRGFEALVRWNHPTRGMVSPADFIPIAEELGLIVPIGRYVLQEACRVLRAWHLELGRNDFAISVNLSPKQVEHDGLETIVSEELAASGLEPRHLVLEITESAVVKDPQLTAKRLQKVADLGVKLAIDDFGTGYSSLSYLRDLPVHILKVDRSFVNDLADGGRGTALVTAIVAMAHSLGLETVAEGVEDGVQQNALETSGCDFAQGFLFARPLTEEATLAFLRERFTADVPALR